MAREPNPADFDDVVNMQKVHLINLTGEKYALMQCETQPTEAQQKCFDMRETMKSFLIKT
jgi:hypothetical protein